jgi:hypothetical protein
VGFASTCRHRRDHRRFSITTWSIINPALAAVASMIVGALFGLAPELWAP